jgi:hypothetical protein
MAVKTMGTLGMSVREMKASPVRMETVTLVGEDGKNLKCVA